MYPSSYSSEQHIRQELAQRRAQAAQARLARQVRQHDRPAQRPGGVVRQLIQRLALLIASLNA